jgi:arsenical resistance protein ArsH
MQVSGGSQSFNAVNTLRLLGRWMRMVTIPNQSSVAMAYKEFGDSGDMQDRMRPSSYYERIADTMEELVRLTVLLRGQSDMLTNRYSERMEAALKTRRVAVVRAATVDSGAVKA